MRKSNLPLAALVCAAALLLFTNPGQAQQSLQAVHNHVRPAVASGQAVPVSFLAPTEHMNLAIMLPLRNQPELTALLGRLNDPTSPDYGHFLSVSQFTEQFGPTTQDYQAVVNFAQANGFIVTNKPPNRLIVDINGSVAQIEKAFHVVMTVYRHPTENRTFHSPDREPSFDLNVPVKRIAGLNNFSIPRPLLKKRAAASAIHSNATGSGPQGAYRPSDMRAAYYGSGFLTRAGQARRPLGSRNVRRRLQYTATPPAPARRAPTARLTCGQPTTAPVPSPAPASPSVCWNLTATSSPMSIRTWAESHTPSPSPTCWWTAPARARTATMANRHLTSRSRLAWPPASPRSAFISPPALLPSAWGTWTYSTKWPPTINPSN